MKKGLIIALLLTVVNQTIGQNYKFGKVSIEELQEKFYPQDSSANAVVLFKNRRTYHTFLENEISLVTEMHYRIKIYNKEGFDWATHKIELAVSDGGREAVGGLKAQTYNLENGKIQITKLSKKEVFKEKESKFRNIQKFTMPNLKEGCVIEWKYKIWSPFYSSVDDVVLQYSIPVKKYKSRITLLGYFNFSKRQKGYISFAIKEESKNNSDFNITDRVYNISVNFVPALKKESFVSNINNYRAGVVFEVSSIEIPGYSYESYSHNWDDVTRNIYKNPKFGGELGKSNFLKGDLAKLNTQYHTKTEKIKGALEFVKSKVKWNGYLGKYCHDGIKNSYKEGTGNSGEINLLLVAVLRGLGLSANPVLISTRDNGIPIIATNDRLNYVIAAVEAENDVILLDATEEFSAPNVLPLRAINWEGRIVRESGSSTTVVLTPSKPSLESNTLSITIDEEGYVEGIQRTNLTGNEALNFRSQYSKVEDEILIEEIEENNEAIEIESFKLLNKDNIYKPIVEMFKFSSEDLVDVVGDKMYFKPLLFNSRTENPFKLEKRDYPIDFGTPFVEKNLINFVIPEGYIVDFIPKNIAIGLKNNYGVYRFVAKVKGNVISIVSILEINTAVYPALNYNEIKEFYKMIVNKNLEQIVLKKVG